ncbi:MAG: hypothetical protein WA634_20395 [Silvibacterium sp.]
MRTYCATQEGGADPVRSVDSAGPIVSGEGDVSIRGTSAFDGSLRSP